MSDHRRKEALDEVAEDPSVEVVWRPHPADDARAVDRLSARFPRLKVSRGGPFVDDLRRADLLVTSPSSVSFEALFADIPVFVHERPDTVDTPATSYYAPARRIVPGEDGVARIREVLAGLAAGRDVLAPERETRRRLFRADDGKPRTVLELLGLTGTPPAPQTA